MPIINPPPSRIPVEMFKTPATQAYLQKQKETVRLLYYNAENQAALSTTSILSYGLKTGDYTIIATDYLIHYKSGSHTVTLIDATTVPAGQRFMIKNSGTGTITADGAGSQTIDDALTFSLAKYHALGIMSTGANWILV